MANQKSVTIKLTEKQRSQLHRATGEAHSQIKVAVTGSPRSPMAPKASLTNKWRKPI